MKQWLSSRFCFELYDAPIVVEPGVGALEISIFVRNLELPANDPTSRFRSWWVFERVDLNGETAKQLPFIATTKYPHIFTAAADFDESPFLLVYDVSGRLAYIYKKEGPTAVWVCHDVVDEVRGRTVSQFSTRVTFSASADRDEFMALLDKLSNAENNRVESTRLVKTALRLLYKADTTAVTATVAIQKTTLSR
jgi:hypothetical protein